MNPRLALLLTVIFVAGLFVRDVRQRPQITYALWIPLLWMLIIGSRFVSQWINPGATGGSTEDGSPIDSVVFAVLIASAVIVLIRRNVSLSAFIANNWWVTVYFLYC